MLRAVPDQASPADEACRHASPAPAPAPAPPPAPVPQTRRRPIHSPGDYAIPLPEWLQRCIEHVPPGSGRSCPTDSEGLLASAFDFAFQLHEGQFRATGEPYIVHPIAVADLLRDIGASAAVIAAGFL
ncbi:MAG: HD domain-containing protein, partial [Cyanobium sp.]